MLRKYKVPVSIGLLIIGLLAIEAGAMVQLFKYDGRCAADNARIVAVLKNYTGARIVDLSKALSRSQADNCSSI